MIDPTPTPLDLDDALFRYGISIIEMRARKREPGLLRIAKARHEAIREEIFSEFNRLRTSPSPGGGAELEAHRRALRLVGTIYFYGGFHAETANEKALEHDLRALGYWYQSEKECLDAYDAEVRSLRAGSHPQGASEGDPDCYCKGNPLIYCIKCGNPPQEAAPMEGNKEGGGSKPCGCPICTLGRRRREIDQAPTVEAYRALLEDVMSHWLDESEDQTMTIIRQGEKIEKLEAALGTSEARPAERSDAEQGNTNSTGTIQEPGEGGRRE